jgi:hypothetical protein
MLSVCDIQGQWRETGTENEWTVDGIIVERAKGPTKIQKKNKPIVLTDGPAGVEWGNGNLVGSMENGCLVWRNRRGETTYSWQKSEKLAEEKPAESVPAKRVSKTAPLVPSSLAKTDLSTKKEDLSPRSSNSGDSGESKETAAMTAGMGSLAMSMGANLDYQQNEIAFGEVQMLLEMARNRLLAGDVYTSMRYITLAQQVQPNLNSVGIVQQ